MLINYLETGRDTVTDVLVEHIRRADVYLTPQERGEFVLDTRQV